MIQKDLTKDSLDYASNKIIKKLQDNYRSNSNSILLPSLAAFTLASCGGGGGSSSYSAPNASPLVAASSTLTIDEDSSSNALNISAPTDPDMDALTITIDSVPAGGSLNKANGDLISSGNTLSVEDLTGLTFTPDTNVSSDIVAMGSLSYTVTDTNGGSATSSVTITVNAIQDAPTIDSDGTVSIDENNTVVISVSGNDVDEDTLVYSISGGSDGDLFQIDSSSGELSLLNKADFELPTDSDTNNKYEVEVTVDDGNGNTVSQDIVVTVANKDSIITLSGLSIDENSAGANIGSLESYIDDTSATDTVSYSVSGNGSELFEVVEGELKLKADSSADFETLSSYELTITATSGTANTAFDFNITINDVNDSPTAINLSSIGISEKIDGAIIGTISTADQDTGDSHTYVISDDRFEIVDGSLKLKAGNTVEYATESSIAITITSTDSAGVEFSQDFSISVNATQQSSNEFAPTFTSASSFNLVENTNSVGTITATDADANSILTYSISGGDDASSFSIDATTGQLTLQSPTSSITSTETPEDQTIIVTVAGSPPGQYYLDGVLFADYQFTQGATYTFDLSDSSNSNHPLRFSETINGTFGGGSEYSTGVIYSGTAGNAGASTTITVTESTPQLYYYCAVHSGMGGEGLLTSQAFDNSLPVTLSNLIDNGNGTFTVDIQVNPSVDSFQALSSVSIWLSSGSSELTFSEDNVTISADGSTKQITTLDDGRVKLDWQETTNSLESGTIGTLTFDAPSSSDNLPLTIEGQLKGGTKDSTSATDGTLKSSVYNFSSGSSNVDYENPTDTGSDNTYNVIIQVSDGEKSSTQAITVNVTNDTSDDGDGYGFGSISSSSLSSLELDNSYMDFGNISPVFTPPDEGFNLSSLNINTMGFEDKINLQIESELSGFVSEREQSNESKELEKIFTDNKLSMVVDDEDLENLSHFSEIG